MFCIRNQNGVLVSDSKDIAQAFQSHYNHLYLTDHISSNRHSNLSFVGLCQIEDNLWGPLVAIPSESEVRKALWDMKTL